MSARATTSFSKSEVKKKFSKELENEAVASIALFRLQPDSTHKDAIIRYRCLLQPAVGLDLFSELPPTITASFQF